MVEGISRITITEYLPVIQAFLASMETERATMKDYDKAPRLGHEFSKEKTHLLAEQAKLKEKMGDTEQRAENWMQKVEEAFDFAVHASYWFEHGTLQDKRKVAARLGSNFVLKDGKLNIQLGNMWERFLKAHDQLQKDVIRLELKENGQPNEKTTDFAAVISSWQGRWGSNPRPTVLETDALPAELRPFNMLSKSIV